MARGDTADRDESHQEVVEDREDDGNDLVTYYTVLQVEESARAVDST